MPLGEFTLNLQGGFIVRTAITVEVMDARAEAYLAERMSFLNDRVITELGNRPVSDFQGAEAQKELKEELMRSLNEVAGNRITDVLFDSLIWQ